MPNPRSSGSRSGCGHQNQVRAMVCLCCPSIRRVKPRSTVLRSHRPIRRITKHCSAGASIAIRARRPLRPTSRTTTSCAQRSRQSWPRPRKTSRCRLAGGR
jgi:hypothetical protein